MQTMRAGTPETPPHATRRYVHDDHYTADAKRMAAAGWRVVALERDAQGAIVASYECVTPPRQARSPIDRRAFFVGVGLGAVFLALLLVALLVTQLPTPSGASTTPPSLSMSAYATAYAATAEALRQPQPTATLAPSPIAGARLGGPLSAFAAAFGPEYDRGVWALKLDGQSVMLDVQTTTTTPDGAPRVWTLGLSYLGATPPTAAQNTTICRQFFPVDAQHLSDDTSYPQTEHIYQSQQLAASLSPGAFQNNAGVNVAPGTFDVSYGTRSCDVTTGQN